MLIIDFRCNHRLRRQMSHGTAHNDGGLHMQIDIDLQLRPFEMVKACGDVAALQQIKLKTKAEE
jgi:hypothetical protein